MSTYAKQTTVSVEKSKTEIEKTLRRFGADKFAHGWETGRAIVEFEIKSRRVRFLLPLPSKTDQDIVFSYGGKHKRTGGEVEIAWEQACRQRWRALNLAILAKLEAVESGITTFEEEFLAHLVLPNGKTVGQWAVPSVIGALTDGKMPPLLPDGRQAEV